MKRLNNLFFSRLPSRKVYDLKGNFIGKVRDISFSSEEDTPRVTSIQLIKKNKLIHIKWKSIDIYEINQSKVIIKCSDVTEHALGDGEFLLNKTLLDRQIVDINGRKVVRVNDIRMAEINGEMKLIAVDIGFTGLLRRLGIEGFIRGLTGDSLVDNLIAWDNVQPMSTGSSSIKLVVPYKKLSRLHPADLADIIEDLDIKYRNAVFQSLDDQTAADILEEIEPDVQVSLIEDMTEERAAEILESMDADEAADILEELPDERVEKLLSHMESEDSEEIRDLMDYEEETVGSLMTTEFISFSPGITAEDTINELRNIKPSSDIAYYIYVVDEQHRLAGVVSLRDLIVSSPQTKLCEIMNPNVLSINDNDSFDALKELVTKYNLLALPVVDDGNVLVGMAIINDIINEVLLPRKRRFA